MSKYFEHPARKHPQSVLINEILERKEWDSALSSYTNSPSRGRAMAVFLYSEVIVLINEV
jgi:hypothetical protein